MLACVWPYWLANAATDMYECMPAATLDLSAVSFRMSSTKETAMGVEAAAAPSRVPCSEPAVMPCRTATLLGPEAVVAPAGATADKMIMEPAVPAAIKTPALNRLRRFAGFKTDPPVDVLRGTLPVGPDGSG